MQCVVASEFSASGMIFFFSVDATQHLLTLDRESMTYQSNSTTKDHFVKSMSLLGFLLGEWMRVYVKEQGHIPHID